MNEHRKLGNQLLDKLKDGQEFSLADINRALEYAGDYAPVGGQGMGEPLSAEKEEIGSDRSLGMVAENLIRLSEKAWTKRR